MPFVTVTALYDNDLLFFPSGKQFTFPAETAQVLGKKSLPTQTSIPKTTEYTPESPLLIIKTIEFGYLYANISILQYFQIIAATYASAGAPEQTLILTVPTDTPAGTTITSPLLLSGTLNGIWINGIAQDIRQTTLVNSGTNGVITIGANIEPLVNGDWVAILYYKN